MIEVKEFPGKQFSDKDELFKALKDNRRSLIAQKKMITKETDAFVEGPFPVAAFKSDRIFGVIKHDPSTGEALPEGKMTMKLVLNTTNLMDSHSDVHIPGLWNKTLKDKRDLYLLQEHKARFDSVISDNVKASVSEMSWSDLGVNYPGKTQALIFDVEAERKDNPFMFDKYAEGKVRQHSVGMRYVKLKLAINSEEKYYREEKDVWDEFIDAIANKEQAEEKGYFWAVTEAKLIEGSAVLMGSNHITPTLEVEPKEPPQGTSKIIEPPQGTQNHFDLQKAIENVKFKL